MELCSALVFSVTLSILVSHVFAGYICNPEWMSMCDDFAVASKGKRANFHEISATLDIPRSSSVSQARGCRNNMKLFVCQMIKHTCSNDKGNRVLNSDNRSGEVTFLPPCREACIRLRNVCLPSRHSGEDTISFAELVQCDALPVRSSRQCQWNIIDHRKRSTRIETTSPLPEFNPIPTTRHPREEQIYYTCECKAAGRHDVGRSVYNKRHFDYALQALYTGFDRIPGPPHNSPTVIKIDVKKVLKDKTIKLNKGKQTLWSNRGCFCSDLERDQTYLFLGYEDTVHNRLLFNETCIAAQWKRKWPNYIRKWEKRLQNKSQQIR